VSGLTRYYLSRTLISASIGVLLLIGGLPWWTALLATVLLIMIFLLLPRSGRYVVKPEAGAAPLRRDERSQNISDRAATIAFIVVMLAIGTLAIYFGLIRQADVPANWLSLVTTLGALSYFVADFRLRRQ
jgi:predicted cobalt transporter CbtA